MIDNWVAHLLSFHMFFPPTALGFICPIIVYFSTYQFFVYSAGLMHFLIYFCNFVISLYGLFVYNKFSFALVYSRPKGSKSDKCLYMDCI